MQRGSGNDRQKVELRKVCATTRSRSGHEFRQRRRFRFETLEHRRLLSTQDASYLISPAWFEQIAPAAVAPADETAVQVKSGKVDHRSQWLIQFTRRGPFRLRLDRR